MGVSLRPTSHTSMAWGITYRAGFELSAARPESTVGTAARAAGRGGKGCAFTTWTPRHAEPGGGTFIAATITAGGWYCNMVVQDLVF